MDKIKVLHVIGGGELGGAEMHVLTIFEYIDKSVFEPHLICLCRGPMYEEAVKRGFNVTVVEMKHKFDFSTIKPIKEYIQRNQIDIVHTHGVRANTMARIAAFLAHKPVVTTFHSFIMNDYDSKLEAMVAKYMTLATSPISTKIITVSNALKNDLIKMGINGNKIITIYNGIDFSSRFATKTREDVLNELNIDPSQKIVSVIARLQTVKGHKYFIDAANIVSKQRDDVQFLLAGDGPLKESLVKQAKDLGISDRVHFIGHRSDIDNIYVASDIICVTSLIEGQSLVIVEAMWHQKPVISTNVGGPSELISDKKTGLLIPPANAQILAEKILLLLNDPWLAYSLALNGKKSVERFSVKEMINKTEKVYKDIIQK
ncbi:Glycosyltransferase involved in cell wall bisynthesis [Caldanaerobius fijiensis DSM 17918]|uniref:Glycosyltransferase involved in cell wall bisynthesis n=1 Tax=Caldanaerobius fijiensis DSM 17918 TaxID=1121256 RepID=A0A1M4VHG6_9THEO|nr:glycosyltransferase [Caldanaerobius fijiensis]SHE68419.1 Glycosyltransferase involved in cell wall bisynthesis [Caldanaerobius fijiensis DSM 17918]